MKVEGDFGKLRQILLVEEFKRCIYPEIRCHLDENQSSITTLEQAALCAAKESSGDNKSEKRKSGKICSHCKKHGHHISECFILKRKTNSLQLLFHPLQMHHSNHLSLSDEEKASNKISILRDTWASQSLLLDTALDLGQQVKVC